MRDAGRINKVLLKIRKIWKQYPDLRLIQLLVNCFDAADPYYVEDDELLELLNKTYPRDEMDIIAGFDPAFGGSSPSEGAKPPLDTDVLQRDIDVLRDLLLLVSYDVPEGIIKQWSPELRQQVEEWAAGTHLAASDNIVVVPNRPDCLDGYEDDNEHFDWDNYRQVL